MKKTIFIYSNFDFSVKNAGVTRMRYYAQALAEDNTKVYLVSCSTTPIQNDSFLEIFPNVFILENNTRTQRFFGTFKFVRNLYNFAQKASGKKSFVFYPSPLVYLELIALFYLKFIKKCHVFYELNEVRKYSSTFHEKGSIRRLKYSVKKLLYKFTFSSMEYLLRFYDGLICISTSIETYGKNFNSNTIRIPILTDPNIKLNHTNNLYRKTNSFNIGLSGSIQPSKENLVNFFKVLGKLKKHNVNLTLNLCGILKKEHEKLLLKDLANALNLKENICYYGNLNEKELSTFLSQQELLVIPRGYTLQNNYGFSTKLSDYLNHKKPILVTDVSDNALYIKDGVNGFIVPTDNNDLMLKKLLDIINQYDSVVDSIQKNAHDTARIFYYKNFAKSLSVFLFK